MAKKSKGFSIIAKDYGHALEISDKLDNARPPINNIIYDALRSKKVIVEHKKDIQRVKKILKRTKWKLG
ncbi:MAG: hypothetical protein KKD01_19850 [Proteobacteria bacterium]|nr:hypothetical protein [Pseudomonadota bacterium]MBU1456975.1 hypothetical protein [Pseudomonadota bacterium]